MVVGWLVVALSSAQAGRFEESDYFAKQIPTYRIPTPTGGGVAPVSVIGEVQVYRIRKGDSLIASQWVTHRDPQLWPDPERFDPERFTPAAEAGRPKFAYFPFGGGPRRCVGEPFAWMEGHLLLAAIAHRYRMSVQPGYVLELEPRVTLRPRHGMPMRLERRG